MDEHNTELIPNEDENNDLVASFDASFKNDNLSDMFVDVAEFGIDQIISNDLVRDIPVVRLLVGVYKTTKNIKDYRLAQKIASFLYSQKDITLNERRKFIEDFCTSNDEHNCSILIDVVDRFDNLNKISIFNNLVKANIMGKITIKQFNRLIVALERVPYSDLYSLFCYYKDNYQSGESEILYASGLIYESVISAGNASGLGAGCKYKLSENGELLLKYGMGINLPSDVQHTQRIPALEWKTK